MTNTSVKNHYKQIIVETKIRIEIGFHQKKVKVDLQDWIHHNVILASPPYHNMVRFGFPFVRKIRLHFPKKLERCYEIEISGSRGQI